MPRYCAVKLCKNRGGVLSKDNKKISFYPFPLRDEARLQKWVDNMKREQWTPSRHQYLCSDHFTEDSFDLRWGIRYLKNTAVPTIFPFIYDDETSPIQDELKRLQSKKNSKPKPKTSDINGKLLEPSSPTKKRALILKREIPKEESGVGEGLESNPGGDEPPFPTVLFLRDLDSEGPGSGEVLHLQALPLGHSEETTEQPGDERTLIVSGVNQLDEDRQCPRLATQDRLRAAISQAIRSLPLSLPGEHPVAGTGDQEREPSSTEYNLLDEHSYSRQDTDKEQLWNKIAGLHVKIMELEKREEETVVKMNTLENLIAHLRKESIVCEEKQKALEDYFTSVFL
ncbi:THAP domain-containing protein 5-like isoform X1 [Brienomyrus brachyistius]|uniref:THAP domain-containing protein 5-like isoform X1 n=1 Tax=Brienomyrus brachyistius TaxID=42636 RepID=UPI0020B3169B|nr:THAP domain-containing protein 5-like isoform X1 [Brienomyrus brachyistius]XP_048864614.1 THAP domain-containing protein 5-like isoform X1 [Brienomyrus brachyistius]